MRRFFAPAQLDHAPTHEFFNGALADFAEVPRRATMILAAIGGAETPPDEGEGPIRAVHDGGYVDFLKAAHARWLAAGRGGDAIGYAWPVVRRRGLSLERIDAALGRYTADACTPIAAGTWAATYASAQSALAATRVVLGGERTAFALCRPPGHHAGPDYAGGYCFLNAAAIAAQAARDAGARRVAVLDIDYHHGNGTQDIFYARDDVFFTSLHADPISDFPYFWGHTDERGEGAGAGATLNLPLPHGTQADAFRRAQGQALGAIARFGPDLLVVSFGADTWAGDPISRFALQTDDYAPLARDIAGCGWPTVIVMEGGYGVDALGANVASFLSGF
jgi:acetoin utilization deacetylase AcuC-like enzyme